MLTDEQKITAIRNWIKSDIEAFLSFVQRDRLTLERFFTLASNLSPDETTLTSKKEDLETKIIALQTTLETVNVRLRQVRTQGL